MRPGMVDMETRAGITTLNARAQGMRSLINLLRGAPDIAGRPILDKTRFAGNFDVVDMQWTGLGAAQTASSDAATANIDAPSLFTALEEKLGLKLTETKAPTDVLVIDSIERPSEN